MHGDAEVIALRAPARAWRLAATAAVLLGLAYGTSGAPTSTSRSGRWSSSRSPSTRTARSARCSSRPTRPPGPRSGCRSPPRALASPGPRSRASCRRSSGTRRCCRGSPYAQRRLHPASRSTLRLYLMIDDHPAAGRRGSPGSAPRPARGLGGPVSGALGRCGGMVPSRLARVAVLRAVIYLFVVYDMILFVNDVVPKGHAPAGAVPADLIPRLLAAAARPPRCWCTRCRSRSRGLRGRGHRPAAAAGRLDRRGRVTQWWLFIEMSYGKVDHDHFALVVGAVGAADAGPGALRSRAPQRGGRVGAALHPGRGRRPPTSWPRSRSCATAAGTGPTARSSPGRSSAAAPHWPSRWSTSPWLLVAGQWVLLVAELTAPLVFVLRAGAQAAYIGFWMLFHVITYAAISDPLPADRRVLASLRPAGAAGYCRRPRRGPLVAPGARRRGGAPRAAGAGCRRSSRYSQCATERSNGSRISTPSTRTDHRCRAAASPPRPRRRDPAVGSDPEQLVLGPLRVVPSASRSADCQAVPHRVGIRSASRATRLQNPQSPS